jgi:glycosyltransferase involved in cell wall biosynthesis
VLKTAGWLSARVPDATITVSRSLTDYYANHHRRRAVYIPNGVAAPQNSFEDLEPPFRLSAGKYILFVGRLVPEKQPDLLINAFRKIRGDYRLVVTGGTSFTNDYVRSLKELAAKDDRVVFTGYVYGSELCALYAKAAAFVLPSTLEGLPLTLLEAAACGTPVVVSDIQPHKEVVASDGRGHRVFPVGDIVSLTSILEGILQEPEAERRAATSLQDRVLETYRWDEVTEATEGVYRRLAGPLHRLPRVVPRPVVDSPAAAVDSVPQPEQDEGTAQKALP